MWPCYFSSERFVAERALKPMLAYFERLSGWLEDPLLRET